MLRWLFGFLFCTLALAPSLAHAQAAVYVLGGVTDYGFTNFNNTASFQSSGHSGGLGVGAFFTLPIQSRVTIGLDARVLESPGSRGGVLGGGALRVGFVPHRNPLRPYFQAGGGVVHSSYVRYYEATYGFNGPVYAVTQAVTKGAAQLLVGLDVRLTDHFDLRIPEVGAEAGAGKGVQTGTAFVDGGLVYHLRPRRQT